MRVDTHVHVTPPVYLEALGGAPGIVPSSAQGLRELMERYEIDAAVVSLGPPGAGTADLARRVNEAAAELVGSDVAALATLPLPDVDAALDELAYALDQLRLDGVFLLSNAAGTYLGDDRFGELFDE